MDKVQPSIYQNTNNGTPKIARKKEKVSENDSQVQVWQRGSSKQTFGK